MKNYKVTCVKYFSASLLNQGEALHQKEGENILLQVKKKKIPYYEFHNSKNTIHSQELKLINEVSLGRGEIKV